MIFYNRRLIVQNFENKAHGKSLALADPMTNMNIFKSQLCFHNILKKVSTIKFNLIVDWTNKHRGDEIHYLAKNLVGFINSTIKK